MKHLILDATENSGKPFIAEDGSNCELIENAEVFETKEDADKKIIDNDWQNWAVVKPLNEC